MRERLHIEYDIATLVDGDVQVDDDFIDYNNYEGLPPLLGDNIEDDMSLEDRLIASIKNFPNRQ